MDGKCGLDNILNANMNVGISTTVLDRNSLNKPLDGIGVYTQSLIKEYEKLGVSLLKYAFPPVTEKNSCHELPHTFRHMSLLGLVPSSKPIDIPADVFHVTDYRSFRMSCPVVTTLYDAIPFIDPTMANSSFRRLKNLVLRRSAHYADHIIAISNFSTKELIEHYRIPESKISVVYCGVDGDWLEAPSPIKVQEVLDRYNLSKGYFLTVGTLQPRKNISRLLRAHNLLSPSVRKGHPILVVGRRGWNCEGLVSELMEKMQKGEAHWLSDVNSREDLKCLYVGAEAFVFPSLYEGFGLPVLEAFAIGVPVLTSNTTSLPEVSNGIALEIDPTNINEISDGLVELLKLRDRDARIAEGRSRAQELSWESCAQQTLDVYRKTIRG